MSCGQDIVDRLSQWVIWFASSTLMRALATDRGEDSVKLGLERLLADLLDTLSRRRVQRQRVPVSLKGREIQPTSEVYDGIALGADDPLRAQVKCDSSRVAHRPNAPTDTITRFEHSNGIGRGSGSGSGRCPKRSCGRQSCYAGTNYQNCFRTRHVYSYTSHVSKSANTIQTLISWIRTERTSHVTMRVVGRGARRRLEVAKPQNL